MEDGDYEREYELLSEMTWTDEIFESHNQQIEDSDDQTSEDQEQDLPQEELEVLNQLIEDIKELKVVQECQKIEQELSNTNVNLVSTSKDAKIEISWSLFNEWEKDCRKLTEVEDKEAHKDETAAVVKIEKMADDHASYVQTELQNYLDSRDFNSIFTRLVESVLEEKPKNVILFMVEYLLESYPDETKEITSKFIKVEEEDEGLKDNVPETPRSPHDSDEEDDIGLDENTKIKRRRERAMAVSAEPIDPKTIKERLKLVPNVVKTSEQTAQLLEIINRSPVLSILEQDQKSTIINALEGPITKAAGEIIINQGDSGDCFYLLQDGTVEVFVRRGRNGEESLTHTYSSGTTFGELSLLYNAPRAASCRAKSDCTLWTLDRLSFRVLVVSSTLRKRERYMSFLRQVPILETLSEMELLAVADALVPEQFSDEAVICEEGQLGEKIYLIEEGEVICTQKDHSTGHENVIANLSKGNYFGEIALLTDKPRQATVRVAPNQSVQLLSLDRATFKRLFGPLDPILRRNMEAYNKFLARNI